MDGPRFDSGAGTWVATNAKHTMSELNLPPGFDQAPADVQFELLASKQSVELAGAIADELNMDAPRGGQLNKHHKAKILLRLRNHREMVNESGPEIADETPADD